MKKGIFFGLISTFTGLLLSSTGAYATEGYVTTTITRTLISGDGTFGGCMAALSAPLSTATNSPNCPSPWVSFSCNGTYTSPELGLSMLDQAQTAMALGGSILVHVDDTKKHNGWCFVKRIDQIASP